MYLYGKRNMRLSNKLIVFLLMVSLLFGFSTVVHTAHMSTYGYELGESLSELYCTLEGMKKNKHIRKDTPLKDFNEGCWLEFIFTPHDKPTYLKITERLVLTNYKIRLPVLLFHSK